MNNTTVVTKRGQTSIPANHRKDLHIQQGQQLVWQKLASNQLLVTIKPQKNTEKPGPLGMLGYGRKQGWFDWESTEDFMNFIRDGEQE